MMRVGSALLALCAVAALLVVGARFVLGWSSTPRPPSRNQGPVQGALISAPINTSRPATVASIPAAPSTAPAPPPSAPIASGMAPDVQPTTAAAAPVFVPAVPPSTAPRVEATSPAAGPGDVVLSLTFDKLASFEYVMPVEPMTNMPALLEGGSEQIPVEIRQFDARNISLKGFMLPLKVQNGLVTELLLMRDQQMCCYGVTPRINEFVNVKVEGKGVKPIMDQPVTLFGRLHVGELRENGYLVGIYRMDATRLATSVEL